MGVCDLVLGLRAPAIYVKSSAHGKTERFTFSRDYFAGAAAGMGVTLMLRMAPVD